MPFLRRIVVDPGLPSVREGQNVERMPKLLIRHRNSIVIDRIALDFILNRISRNAINIVPLALHNDNFARKVYRKPNNRIVELRRRILRSTAVLEKGILRDREGKNRTTANIPDLGRQPPKDPKLAVQRDQSHNVIPIASLLGNAQRIEALLGVRV